MRNTFLFLTTAVFVLTLGIAALDSATGSAVAGPLGADDDPQTAPPPPRAVSPADPEAAPPDAGGWVCPRCGAECPGPVWRHKGHMGRPQLGPGPETGRSPRPGRWGREGGSRDRKGTDARPHACGTGRAGNARPGAHGGFAAEMMLRHAKELKLTDDQIGKLEGLAYETKKKLVDLHAEIQKSAIEVQSLLRSESDDLTQIKRHLGAAAKARAEIQEARIAHLFEVRKVLTPEQREMMKEEFPRLGRIID